MGRPSAARRGMFAAATPHCRSAVSRSVLRCEGLRGFARVFVQPSQTFFIAIPICSFNLPRVARVYGVYRVFSGPLALSPLAIYARAKNPRNPRKFVATHEGSREIS